MIQCFKKRKIFTCVLDKMSRKKIMESNHWVFNGKELSKNLFVVLLIFSFVISKLSAQMNGWPLSSHGSTIVNSDQLWCTDKAKVSAMSTGATVRQISMENFDGSFSYGDWVMVIQMHQSTGFTGKFTLCEVVTPGTTYPSTSFPFANILEIKPYVLSPYSNTWPSFTFSSSTNDLVQIVKVKRFWNLTINSGVITCPAFDFSKGTGGVLAVMVGNQFTMSGGYLNVTGKGFNVKFNSGGTLGVGGNGANALSGYISAGSCMGSNGGSVDFPTNLGYSIPYLSGSAGLNYYGEAGAILNANSLKNFGASIKGNPGSISNNPLTSGTNTNGVINFTFSHSNYSTNDLHLGCSGNCGFHSASGGGGGGFGGTGGSSFRNITPGYIGYKGENGKKGGNAGEAGAGGGIIYLKVANSTLSFGNSQKRFLSYGTNGGNGGNGGDGGKGGMGGFGANGGCQSGDFITSGGMGGLGDGGNAGNGGDGGNGGCGGPIWILKKNGGTHSNFSNFVSSIAGKGGKGGSSGFKYTFTRTPRPTNYSPSLSGSVCNNPIVFTFASQYKYCPPVVCDCDEVFRHLGADLSTDVRYSNVSGAKYKIISNSNPSLEPIYWDGTDLLSYSKISGTCTTKYECRMRRNDLFIDFMDKLFGKSDLLSYSGTGSLISGLVSVGMIGSKTQLYSNAGYLIYEYDPNTGRLTDYDDFKNPYVTAQACDQTTGALVWTPPITGSGPGGTNTVEIPFIDDAPFVGNPTGNSGLDGNDAGDGEFFEDNLVSTVNHENNGFQIANSELFDEIDNKIFEKVGNSSNSGFEDNLNNYFLIRYLDNDLLIKNIINETGSFSIINNLGQEISSGILLAQCQNVMNLKSGIYYVKIKLKNREFIKKIFVGRD